MYERLNIAKSCVKDIYPRIESFMKNKVGPYDIYLNETGKQAISLKETQEQNFYHLSIGVSPDNNVRIYITKVFESGQKDISYDFYSLGFTRLGKKRKVFESDEKTEYLVAFSLGELKGSMRHNNTRELGRIILEVEYTKNFESGISRCKTSYPDLYDTTHFYKRIDPNIFQSDDADQNQLDLIKRVINENRQEFLDCYKILHSIL